ncbi:MAG: phage major capsid protein [Candidatus Binatia bacterium]
MTAVASTAELILTMYDQQVSDSIVQSVEILGYLPKRGVGTKGATWKHHYGRNTSATYIATDTGSVQTADVQDYDEATLALKTNTASIEISILAASAETEEQIADVWGEEIDRGINDLVQNLSDTIWTDGTGNSNADITGFAAGIDNGDNVGTYAGLARSSFSWWKSILDATGGDLSTALFYSMWTALRKRGAIISHIFTDPDQHAAYEQLVAPGGGARYDVTRTGQGETIGIGAKSLMFKNIPVIDCGNAPAGKVWFMDMRDISFRDRINFGVEDKSQGTSTLGRKFALYQIHQLQVRNPYRQGAASGLTIPT